jgi:16S rRNA G1207 methylase RsmC
LTLRSAADELLIDWAVTYGSPTSRTTVVHDRFGVVTLSVPGTVSFVPTFHSQLTALRLNGGTDIVTGSLLQPASGFDLALLRLPKSLDLFTVYLRYLTAAAAPGSRIACGFMTRYFTPRMVEIARRFAGKVEQSRARKKARLLILENIFDPSFQQTGPLPTPEVISFAGKAYRQLPGVFSSGRIDPATRYLLEHWATLPLPATAPIHLLDIGCGNGVIGDRLLARYPEARLTAFDDHLLAVASSRLNVPADRSTVCWGHRVADTGVEAVDLVVTNPPFHLGHETNIEVSLSLFRQARAVLLPGGYLVVVANRHLNYRTHLGRMFQLVESRKEGKFEILVCRKAEA